MIGLGYYVLRDKIPFIIWLVYEITKNKKNYFYDLFFGLVNWTYIMSLILFIYSSRNGYQIWFPWTYSSPISWIICDLIITYLLMKKCYNLRFSTMIGSLLICSGGYVYEVPRFLREGQALIRAQPQNVFIISFQIISLIILLHYLKALNVKPSNRTKIFLLIYFIHASLFYIGNLRPLSQLFGNFHYRAPLIFLMISFIHDSPTKS